jgi:2-dehydro-3-deoxygluconokinase
MTTHTSRTVTFGEIMLRLAPEGHRRFSQADRFDAVYGGGEANVAVSLANYGVPVSFVTRLPDNALGNCAVAALRRHGVDTADVLRGGERLGIYFLETGASARASKVVYDRAQSAFSTIERGMINWEHVLDGASWFHWTGITPAVSQGAADACLDGVRMANRLGITVSCDLNYRAKLWRYGKSPADVMNELVAGCDVILGNEEDADKVFGIRPKGVDVSGGHVEGAAYESVAKALMERFPLCRKVVITLRGSKSASHNTWSGVLFNGKRLFAAREYDITHIVDRVGGGDAFMGGLIYGLQTWPDDDQRALDFAVAASCLKHTIPGDFNQVTIEEVEKLMAGDASGRVVR